MYDKNLTPEICLAAMTHHGDDLHDFKDMTPEMCAAKLREMKEKTPRIADTVNQNGYSIVTSILAAISRKRIQKITKTD